MALILFLLIYKKYMKIADNSRNLRIRVKIAQSYNCFLNTNQKLQGDFS